MLRTLKLLKKDRKRENLRTVVRVPAVLNSSGERGVWIKYCSCGLSKKMLSAIFLIFAPITIFSFLGKSEFWALLSLEVTPEQNHSVTASHIIYIDLSVAAYHIPETLYQAQNPINQHPVAKVYSKKEKCTRSCNS